MKIAYINRKFVPFSKAKVPIADRGFQYGEGAFETMRSYGGFVFRLEEHLKRLRNAAGCLGIKKRISEKAVKNIVSRLLEKNNYKNAYIKIIVTRKTFLIFALPYKPLSENRYRKGYKICVSPSSVNKKNYTSGKKTLNYLENILARSSARKNGFNEAVLLDTEGNISEATNANIFIFKNKKLLTPPVRSGILPGITRSEVLKLARKFLEYSVSEKTIKKKDLYSAQEAFITNSLIEIMPVVKADKKKIGTGKEGPVTAGLRRLFRASVNTNCSTE